MDFKKISHETLINILQLVKPQLLKAEKNTDSQIFSHTHNDFQHFKPSKEQFVTIGRNK